MPSYAGNFGFTDTSAIYEYFGEEGIELITDDLTAAQENSAVQKAILEAEDFMLQWLLNRYEPEDLQGVSWMERRCTEMAVFFLFHRRGQDPPQALHNTAVRIQTDLENVANNRIMIPGAQTRLEPAPGLSNYAIDNRRIKHRMRVVGSETIGHPPDQKRLRDYFSDKDF